ncbi:MAG: YfiR family protein [bacterium]
MAPLPTPRRGSTRTSLAIAVAAVIAMLLAPSAVAFADPSDRSDRSVQPEELRAALVFSFMKFVEWPDSVFEAAGSPYRILVVGEKGEVQQIRILFEGRAIDDRPLAVFGAEERSSRGVPHVALFCTKAAEDTAKLLEECRRKPILTIGDSEGFVDLGGVIRLINEDNRFRFEIAQASALSAGLKVSARLLQVAARPSEQPSKGAQ